MDILSQSEIIYLVLIMIATAVPAGFAAGLFGIGGGLVTVPILFYIFSFSGIETAYVMHLAVGTSFGIIIPTSTVSVLTHHQHKAVDFGIVKGFGFFVAAGVILGTLFAASLETKPLILFSLDMAITKDSPTKMKVKKAPVTNNREKSKMALLRKSPYSTNGIPNPNTKLRVSEPATPKYCPINMELRLIGWAKRSSVNSREL